MTILWMPKARTHLIAIRSYIASDNPQAADRMAIRIRAAIAFLAEHPHIGRVGQWAGTRELVISGTPYIAPYRVNGQVIEILAIFHGRQDWTAAR